MKHIAGAAVALATLAVASGPLSRPAAAQDACTKYANDMVAIDQRARTMKCPNWRSHSNWNSHFDWCLKQPAGRPAQALEQWEAKFDGCAIYYGGQGGGYQPPKPAAATDQSRRPVCSSFARYGVQWRNKAVAKGCDAASLPDRMLSFSEQQLMDWCMRTTDAEFRTRSPQALGYKAQLERQCAAQKRRPFKL